MIFRPLNLKKYLRIGRTFEAFPFGFLPVTNLRRSPNGSSVFVSGAREEEELSKNKNFESENCFFGSATSHFRFTTDRRRARPSLIIEGFEPYPERKKRPGTNRNNARRPSLK